MTHIVHADLTKLLTYSISEPLHKSIIEKLMQNNKKYTMIWKIFFIYIIRVLYIYLCIADQYNLLFTVMSVTVFKSLFNSGLTFALRNIVLT